MYVTGQMYLLPQAAEGSDGLYLALILCADTLSVLKYMVSRRHVLPDGVRRVHGEHLVSMHQPDCTRRVGQGIACMHLVSKMKGSQCKEHEQHRGRQMTEGQALRAGCRHLHRADSWSIFSTGHHRH